MNFANWKSDHWALAIVLVGGAVLTEALILEHLFNMAPCPLCLMQRIWIFIAAAWAYLSLIHNPRLGIYPLATGIAAVVGAGFSIRQLWLQSLPPGEAPACGPGMDYMISNFPLGELLQAMVSGTGDCAQVSWRFLGLTIPGWALVCFAIILFLAVMQWRRKRLA